MKKKNRAWCPFSPNQVQPKMVRLRRFALVLFSAFLITLSPSSNASAKTVSPTHSDQIYLGGTLSVTASLSHGALLKTQPNDVYASIQIKGRKQARTNRPPLNLSIVIDRSTSMEGDKIIQAKRAAMTLLEFLEPQDRLAIISYGTDVKVEMESLTLTDTNRSLLSKAIRGISLSGSTNMAGGLAQGCHQVVPHNRDESLNRVLLLSDGHANVGVSSAKGLGELSKRCLERGVTTTAIGVGLDYNEDLMARVARDGAGNYHFIENENALAQIFAAEANALTTAIARSTSLQLEMHPGVEMLEIHGFSFTQKGNSVSIPLADFLARQTKDVLVRLNVSTGNTSSLPIMDVRIVYDDLLHEKRIGSTGTLVAQVADKDAVVRKHLNRDVFSRAQQVEVAGAMEEAMREFENGNRQGAVKTLKAQRKKMAEAQEQYDFAPAPVFDRVDQELDQMQNQVTQTEASSPEGKRMRKRSKKRALDIQQEAAAF